MILTRTPLRISLGGGGTDLPSYYEGFGGFVLSAAINKYVYITVHRRFFPGYLLKYSEFETAAAVGDIRHPLLREALRDHGGDGDLEIVSIADVHAGTGLGSSGSFLVGLLHALHAYRRNPVSAETLAREAVEIEMVRLGEPVGKQDQYVAAYGGLLCQHYHPNGEVTVEPLRLPPAVVHELRDSLMLFFVGQTRSASTLLGEQKQRSESGDAAMIEGLHFTKDLGQRIKAALEEGRVEDFGAMMHEHWLHKRARSRGMSNGAIDALYDLACGPGGATGGKLVGAGGGGFLLFHTHDRRRLRRVMMEAGLGELDFTFDFEGSTVLLRD